MRATALLRPLPLLLASLLLSSAPAAAQETLFGDPSFTSFASPVVELTSFGGETALLAGGDGGWVLEESVGLGVGLRLLATPRAGTELTTASGGAPGLLLGWVAPFAEWTHRPSRMAHVSLRLAAGFGGATYVSDAPEADDLEDGFWIVEPGVRLDVNLTPSLALGVGPGWRFVDGVELPGLDDDLGGPTLAVGLRWGGV